MADGAEGRKGAEATPISRDRLWLVVYDLVGGGLLLLCLVCLLSAVLAAGLLSAVLLVALSDFLRLSVLAGLLAVLLTGRASLAVTALSTRATAGLRGFLLLRCLGGYTDAKRKGAGTSQNQLLHYCLKVNR